MDSIPNNVDSLQIRLISGTDTIYFNIKYPKEKTALKDYFRDSVFKNTGYTTYPITKSGIQSIKLPTLDSGCSYSFPDDSTLFAMQPTINNGNLNFILKPDLGCLHKSIKIIIECDDGCTEEYNFPFSKIDLKSRFVNSCDGPRIQAQYCGISYYKYYPIRFLLHKEDGTIDTNDADIDVIISGPGRYIIEYINLISGTTLQKDTIDVLPGDINEISLKKLSVKTRDSSSIGDSNTYCIYEVLYFISGVDISDYYVVTTDDFYAKQIRDTIIDGEPGYYCKVTYKLLCDSNDTEGKTVYIKLDLKGSEFNHLKTLCFLETSLQNCCSEGFEEDVEDVDSCANIVIYEPICLSPEFTYELAGPHTFTIIKNYVSYVIHATADKPIASINVNKLPICDSDTKIVPYNEYKVLIFSCPFTAAYSAICSVEVCVIFEDGIECCDSIQTSYSCFPYITKFGTGVIGKTINIVYELADIPSDSLILNIGVYDSNDTKQMDLMSEVPTQISDTLTYDISSLLSGNYNIICKLGNQLVVAPFTIEYCIIEFADISPNPTDGFTTISYILSELPSSQIRVRVVNEITGFEYMSTLTMPTDLEDTIELNVSSLVAGSYLVVLEVENSIFYIPRTLKIIKE